MKRLRQGGIGRLRSWLLFVGFLVWCVGAGLLGESLLIAWFGGTLIGVVWLRSVIDPQPWSRARWRRDLLMRRATRLRLRAIPRAERMVALRRPQDLVPSSTGQARSAARRKRTKHAAKRLGTDNAQLGVCVGLGAVIRVPRFAGRRVG